MNDNMSGGGIRVHPRSALWRSIHRRKDVRLPGGGRRGGGKPLGLSSSQSKSDPPFRAPRGSRETISTSPTGRTGSWILGLTVAARRISRYREARSSRRPDGRVGRPEHTTGCSNGSSASQPSVTKHGAGEHWRSPENLNRVVLGILRNVAR